MAQKIKMEMVMISNPVKGSLHRDPAGGEVMPSGRTGFNAEAVDMLNALARDQELDLETFCVMLGRNVKAKFVGIYTVKAGTEGATNLRRDVEKNRYRIHLGPLFKEYSELRPSARRQCPLSRETDDQERPFLLLNLNASEVKRAETSKQTASAKQKQA